MNVAVTARTAGKVTINVVGDRLLATQTVDVQAGTAKIPLKVGNDWGSGAYVVATLRRPLDEAASRMPGRAIGLQWFSVDRQARTLAFEMPLPSLMRPNGTLRVPVRLNGLAPGEEAKITVAAVDVGILNLTNYKPPSPDDFYLGQRRLTAEIRDIYGQLLDGMQGTRGAIRTGGDGAAASLGATPPTQPPLALFSGVVSVKPDGTAEVSFDIPAFAGTVRVMAVAWSKDKVGHASGDVIVRDAGRAHRDLAALPADRRSRLDPPRSRQRRRSVRRVRDQRRDRRSGRGRAEGAEGPPQQQAALRRQPAGQRDRGRHRQCRDPHQRAEQLRHAAQLHAGGEARHAGADAPHGAADRQRRKRLALERPVRRSHSGHRQRAALGRSLDRARRRGAAQGARPLSVRMHRTDDQPRAAAALRQRARGGVAALARRRDRPAHPRCDRAAAVAPGLERLVRPVGRGRRRRLARRLRHRLPDAGARAQLRRAGCRVPPGARQSAQPRRRRAIRPRT